MLYMRVPGAAVALVGSHVDDMEEQGADADLAATQLHTVVSNFIRDKAESVSKRKRCDGMNAESATTMDAHALEGDERAFSLRGTSAEQRGSFKAPQEPLVLHGEVFMVSLDPTSVHRLRYWVGRAATGHDCPSGFDFPAVDQKIPKAWIEAYDTTDVLREAAPYVLWSTAVEEFKDKTGESFTVAGRVLLRAMQHREAEGGVLLTLADATAPVATDMLQLDPSWLIELVRRLADHNLVDERKRGTLEHGLRTYATQRGLRAGPLFDMHRAYCASGHTNKAYLRFLWMHRKVESSTRAIAMTDSEFDSVVSTMIRLLVMYPSRVADNFVVPVRLPEYGNQRILAPGAMERSVVKIQCSFGQQYPPPGIIGRFLAWLTPHVEAYVECWLHGAFFKYTFRNEQYRVFLYESEYEELHDDGTERRFAGLTLGAQVSRGDASLVLKELRGSLEQLVYSADGYPGLADLMYFSREETTDSATLWDLRALLDNMEAAAERVEKAAGRVELAASSLEETAKKLGGVVSQLLQQPLLSTNDEQSEYPRLVLLRPEKDREEGTAHERIQRAGWGRWMNAVKGLSDVGVHHKFRLHFLCEHDLSEVPCGPEGRGFPVEHPRDWVKQCLPLMQVSLWLLRVAVGTVSNVDLPLHEVLGAFVQATGAELLDGMSKVPDMISTGSLPVFGDGATEAEIKGFKELRGTAYESLCKFMQEVESSPPRCSSRCLPCFCSVHSRGDGATANWRDGMVQVTNPRTGGRAWVLKTNKEAYLRDDGGAPVSARSLLLNRSSG